MAVLISLHGILFQIRYQDSFSIRHQNNEILNFIGKERGSILAENPAFPVLAGQKAFVLDPFMLNVIRKNDPSFAELLFDRLHDRWFGAIVLFKADPRTPWGRRRLDNTIFGKGFADTVEENYYLAKQFGTQLVYLPHNP